MTVDEIYKLNPDGIAGDRRHLTTLIPIMVDWMVYHPTDPFNMDKARKEFPIHAAEALKRKAKRDAYARKKAKKLREEYESACRKIAEKHFEVVVTAENFEKIVRWDEQIIDPETKEKIGTPREIWRLSWVMDVDPRKDKDGYLNEMRNKFEDKTHRFRFTRKPTKDEILRRLGRVVSPTEKAPFDVERNPTFHYELTLRWK